MNGEDMQLVTTPILRSDLRKHAEKWSTDFVKAVVDIARGVMVIGADLHVDEEQLLLAQGSRQEDLWGINFYPDRFDDGWIEFDSMVNIRPRQGNRSRKIEDSATQERIRAIVHQLVPR